jgi:GR25 family glycosyltransferase involved in LPS biosynthesis
MKNIIIFICILIVIILLFIYFKDFKEENIKENLENYIDLIDKIKIKRINQIPVYYINMDKDIDRRKYMESQLPYHFKRYYRIPGVNGKLIKNKNHDIVDGIEFFNEFNNNSTSEIGCTLSHLLSIKTAYDNGEEVACIMEDDVYMNLLNVQGESLDDFVKTINNNLDWEILQLYYHNSNNLNKNFIKIKDYTLHLHNKGKYTYSTAFYIINRKGMEKILSNMGNNPFYLLKKMSMEGVADYIIYDQAKTYTLNPSIIIPNNTEIDSTIHTDHTNDHLKSSFNTLKKYENKIQEKVLSNLKFLNIIIYNENEDYERLMKIELETYLKRFNNVIFYFVTYREQNQDIMIENNCIYINGKEGFVPQCLDKTIIAIDYCLNQLNIDFDFLIRSNISTVINFNKFPYQLPLTKCYSSASIYKLNWLDIPFGINKNNFNILRGTEYAGGTNIIMSKDVVEYLLSYQNELDRTVIDDVSIGFLLNKKYKLIEIKQYKKFIENKIDKDAFIIRNKSKNRYDDVKRMKTININKKVAIITSIYGSYDSITEQNNISEVDLYCFTNEEIKSNSWKIITTPYHLSDNTKGKNSIHDNINNHSIYNMMIAKYYKIQSHYIDILQSYDYIVWIDARVLVKNEFIPFIFSMIEKNKKLINYQHSERNNIMKEVSESLKQKRYVEQKIINQYQIYKERGFPDQSGLFENTVFIRTIKDKNINDIFDLWWKHNVEYSFQDQLSYPYVLWKSDIYPDYIIRDGTVWNSKYTSVKKNHKINNEILDRLIN